MAVRPKPGGNLSEFLADMSLQRRQQQGEEEMAIYKFQVWNGFPSHLNREQSICTNILNTSIACTKYTDSHTQRAGLKAGRRCCRDQASQSDGCNNQIHCETCESKIL